LPAGCALDFLECQLANPMWSLSFLTVSEKVEAKPFSSARSRTHPRSRAECPHAPTGGMIKKSILPMKSAPPPKRETKKAAFMRVIISIVLLSMRAPNPLFR